jgi:hypothetical protein
MLVLKELELSIEGRLPMVFCQRNPNRLGVYLQPMALDPPSAACYVCNTAQLTLRVRGAFMQCNAMCCSEGNECIFI